MPTWNTTEEKTINDLIKTAKVTTDLSWYTKVVLPKFIKGKAQYKAVQDATGVPMAMVALIHLRESASDLGVFKAYLGNGQSLTMKTTIVPKGRGPFSSWQAGAIDAITLQGLQKISSWSLTKMLYFLEAYNGFGYRTRLNSKGQKVNSPYIWGFTNHYTDGYYTSDGVYSPKAVSKNIGCFAAYYKLLIAADKDFELGSATAEEKKAIEEMPIEGQVPAWFAPFKAFLEQLMKWFTEEKQDVKAPATEEPEKQSLLDRILKENPFLNSYMVAQALAWFDNSAIKNKDIMVLVDFNVVESKKRMFLVDMKTFKATGYKVAHGTNSDKNKDGKTDSFSNIPNSRQSSLGAMVLTKQYGNKISGGWSKFPYACQIQGLEKGLNDKVASRAIVFHSSAYVNDVDGQAIGDSWGCFAVSEKTASTIISKIDEGCLLYSYHESIRKV